MAAVDAAARRRRRELRDFLMSRRARISPAEAGLPEGGARRRTPGLRREEVAVLAGVGVSWYQWLEQGRDITVSDQVLDSVARVLRLDDTERRHLYMLAGLNPPLPRPGHDGVPVCAELRRLLESWMPFPANIIDRYWNNICANEAAVEVFDLRQEARNCLANYFLNPVYQRRHVGWEEDVAQLVAEYRAQAAEFPDDEGFHLLVEELAGESALFAELWAQGEVRVPAVRRKLVAHPVVGELAFEVTLLKVPARPDVTVSLSNPAPGTDTAVKLEWLAGSDGRRGALRPVAS